VCNLLLVIIDFWGLEMSIERLSLLSLTTREIVFNFKSLKEVTLQYNNFILLLPILIVDDNTLITIVQIPSYNITYWINIR
jgi:hypothetical protein